MEAYELRSKHEFKVGQADDEGFPIHHRQPEILPTADAIFRQIISETTYLAGMLDIPIHVILAATFHQSVIERMEPGMEMSHLAPETNFAEAMMTPSHVTLVRAFHRCRT
jgi:hypothetical protein